MRLEICIGETRQPNTTSSIELCAVDAARCQFYFYAVARKRRNACNTKCVSFRRAKGLPDNLLHAGLTTMPIYVQQCRSMTYILGSYPGYSLHATARTPSVGRHTLFIRGPSCVRLNIHRYIQHMYISVLKKYFQLELLCCKSEYRDTGLY